MEAKLQHHLLISPNGSNPALNIAIFFVEANLVSLLPITSHNNPNQDFLYYAYIPPKINPFKLFRHVFHCNHFILANQCLKSWKTYQSLLKAGSTVVACVLQCMSINGFALNLKKLITKNY